MSRSKLEPPKAADFQIAAIFDFKAAFFGKIWPDNQPILTQLIVSEQKIRSKMPLTQPQKTLTY